MATYVDGRLPNRYLDGRIRDRDPFSSLGEGGGLPISGGEPPPPVIAHVKTMAYFIMALVLAIVDNFLPLGA